MTLIIFLQPDGTCVEAEAEDAASVMEVAVRHRVPGILARCGGVATCGTCHIYVQEGAADIGAPTILEQDMLDFVADDRAPNSRLACQVKPQAGKLLVVRIPERQV